MDSMKKWFIQSRLCSGDYMDWFNTLKFHPELRRLSGKEPKKVIGLGSDESKVKEMWDASNPDSPHTLRSQKDSTANYPVDNWFGVIIEQDGKYRLVAISGFSVREGKDGKKFAYKGGTKSSVKGYGTTARDKAIDNKPSIPTIAGYTAQGKQYMTGDIAPSEHEVIPDEVLEHFRQHYGTTWDITKWFNSLRI